MLATLALDPEKQEFESNTEYVKRLCDIRKSIDMTWADVAACANKELGLTYSESWYRKNYKNGLFDSTILDTVMTEETSTVSNDDSVLDTVDSKLRELALKKCEISDLVTQNNLYIRRLSREETIKTIAHEYAEVMRNSKPLEWSAPPQYTLKENEGILLLSDWHYGMTCDNPWNKFDPDICVQRVTKLFQKVIDIVKTNRIYHVTVMDLSDLIAGRIHTQIRIESRYDVITQTMNVSEILADCLTKLSSYCDVSFYSCLDNHSRLEPNKKQSLDLESLCRLIPWYLKERLADNDRIKICDNPYGDEIITCEVHGHNIIGVHGDNDKPATALEKLSLMTHDHYDLLCTAHLHHFSAEETYGTVTVGNASLMGVDAYAAKLRLSSKPSQTFIIATPENVCECIYKINLL